jgi:hypothetical protein
MNFPSAERPGVLRRIYVRTIELLPNVEYGGMTALFKGMRALDDRVLNATLYYKLDRNDPNHDDEIIETASYVLPQGILDCFGMGHHVDYEWDSRCLSETLGVICRRCMESGARYSSMSELIAKNKAEYPKIGLLKKRFLEDGDYKKKHYFTVLAMLPNGYEELSVNERRVIPLIKYNQARYRDAADGRLAKAAGEILRGS